MRFPGKGGKLGLLLLLAGSGLILRLPPSLMGQKVVSARAGLITYLQGQAFVDGKPVVLRTARFQQMRSGEALSTGRGRAELLLAPGVFLRLPENSQVRMDDTQLSDTRITLEQGDALIEVVQLADGSRIQVGLGETTAELTRPGVYRFGTAQNGAQNAATLNTAPNTTLNTTLKTLRVYGGEALVRSGSKTAAVKRGMAVDLDTNLNLDKFDRTRGDALHLWAARRSFELFMSDPEIRQRQTHWESFGTGYVENRNFGVKFRAVLRRRPPLESPPPFGSRIPPIEER